MKSNPAAVDVAARWAEASEKRSKMPLLTDVLQFKEDKSSEECPPPKTVPNKRGSEAQSSAGPAAEKRAKDPRSHTPSPAEKEAKVPEKELSAENEGVQAERPQTGESAVSQNAPGAGTKKRKPDDFPQATLKEMPAATWTSRPKHTAPSKGAKPPLPLQRRLCWKQRFRSRPRAGSIHQRTANLPRKKRKAGMNSKLEWGRIGKNGLLPKLSRDCKGLARRRKRRKRTRRRKKHKHKDKKDNKEQKDKKLDKKEKKSKQDEQGNNATTSNAAAKRKGRALEDDDSNKGGRRKKSKIEEGPQAALGKKEEPKPKSAAAKVKAAAAKKAAAKPQGKGKGKAKAAPVPKASAIGLAESLK